MSRHERQTLHTEDAQAMSLEQRLECGEREIKNMLVIDHVELRVPDEVCAVGKLQRDAARHLKKPQPRLREM